jgi:hypothetical protein
MGAPGNRGRASEVGLQSPPARAAADADRLDDAVVAELGQRLAQMPAISSSERLAGVVLSATSASMRFRGAVMCSIAFDASVLWMRAIAVSVLSR